MSKKARQKLAHCLAKNKLCSASFLRRFLPKSSEWTSSLEFTINGVSPDNVQLANAGDVIESQRTEKTYVNKIDEVRYLNSSDYITFDTGSVVIPKLEIRTNKQRLLENQSSYVRFLLPLPQPYRYTAPICEVLGVDSHTIGVSFYPDCR